MIPESDWKWFGFPLHFICANRCSYHLGTLVGKYVISTVGAMQPLSIPSIDEEEGIQQIGYKRYYETFVFRASGIKPCGCPEIEPAEIDAAVYGKNATCEELDAGHLEMCRKYAAGGEA